MPNKAYMVYHTTGTHTLFEAKSKNKYRNGGQYVFKKSHVYRYGFQSKKSPGLLTLIKIHICMVIIVFTLHALEQNNTRRD